MGRSISASELGIGPKTIEIFMRDAAAVLF
jgi:hypothetical protein